VIFRGFRFGRLLQLFGGPVFLLALNISGNYGVAAGFTVTAAVVFGDALYILLAGLEAASVLTKKAVRKTRGFSYRPFLEGCRDFFQPGE
jgi:threonine/homoserine/homoserine lactone efflux protein